MLTKGEAQSFSSRLSDCLLISFRSCLPSQQRSIIVVTESYWAFSNLFSLMSTTQSCSGLLKDVVILGSGAFGLEAMEAAHRAGAKSITVITRDRDR